MSGSFVYDQLHTTVTDDRHSLIEILFNIVPGVLGPGELIGDITPKEINDARGENIWHVQLERYLAVVYNSLRQANEDGTRSALRNTMLL